MDRRGFTYVSTEAKAYRRQVALWALAARVKPLPGPLVLTVHFYRPRKVGDLSNRIKVLEDALNGIAWADDSQVVELHAYRHDDKANPRADVEVAPAA